MEQILGELIRAETRFKTQAKIDAPDSGSVAFAAGRAPPTTRKFAVSGNNSQGSSEAYCRHCSEKGHTTSHCKKRNFCNYCKTPGHIILDCPTLRNREKKSASRGAYSAAAASPVQVKDSAPLTASSIEDLVHSALQKLLPTAINSAFATACLSGKTWHIDSAAYNHMTGNKSLFHTYSAVNDMSVQVASGDVIPVVGKGSVCLPSLSIDNVLHVPRLAPNLISVG
ncbi:Retrovirus-related Pol polyprotein from transposon TNT 1-94 [Linum grandiflorum]